MGVKFVLSSLRSLLRLDQRRAQVDVPAGKGIGDRHMNTRSGQTKILVVDDEVGFTRLLKIAAAHYEIRTVNESVRAVDAAVDFEPDLIFLDRYMPGMSGEDLAAAFHEHPRLKTVPIAFVTGSPPKEGHTFATHINGWPVLVKPVSIDTINACVERLLAR